MQVPGTRAAQRDKEYEQKRFAERQMNRKLDFVRLREPCDFPNVENEISDKKFIAMLEQFQQVYNCAHGLNQVFWKYQQAANNLLTSNQGLKLSSSKAYSQSNDLYPTCQEVAKSHDENVQPLKDFMQKLEQFNQKFQLYFLKFGTIYARLKQRDQSFEKFKHYYRKLEKMNEDRLYMKNKGLSDPKMEAQEQEAQQRNEKKYQLAFREFQAQNKPLYVEIQDLVKNKYQHITPLALKFNREAAIFFIQIGAVYDNLNTKLENAYFTIQPLEHVKDEAEEQKQGSGKHIQQQQQQQQNQAQKQQQQQQNQQHNNQQEFQQQQKQSQKPKQQKQQQQQQDYGDEYYDEGQQQQYSQQRPNGGYNDIYERAYQEEIASKKQVNQKSQYTQQQQQQPKQRVQQQHHQQQHQDYYDDQDDYYDDQYYHEDHNYNQKQYGANPYPQQKPQEAQYQQKKKEKKSGIKGILNDMGFDKEQVAQGILGAIFKDKRPIR
eukprot:403346628